MLYNDFGDMMEKLDIYDEKGKHIGIEDRNVVHTKALWHNTVHCWLYDNRGIYFQIRKDEGKIYTTASGHVLAGETIKEGFGREVKEEIGICVDYDKAVLVNIVKFVMDKTEKDGSIFRDRAFANVYICAFDGDYEKFDYDENEVSGLVRVDVSETLELLAKGTGEIDGTVFIKKNGKIVAEEKKISFSDFLVNEGETALEKYGDVLRKIVELKRF